MFMASAAAPIILMKKRVAMSKFIRSMGKESHGYHVRAITQKEMMQTGLNGSVWIRGMTEGRLFLLREFLLKDTAGNRNAGRNRVRHFHY